MKCPRPIDPIAVDLFCGFGGFTEGAEQAGVVVVAALNHNRYALINHAENHPGTHHALADVWAVTGPKLLRAAGVGLIDLVLAAPSCTHHSRAKGGRPLDNGLRSHADAVTHYIRELLAATMGPRALLLENVPEFRDWGPLDDAGRPIPERKGEDFRRWVDGLKMLGARVEWRVLNAADYGAPTHRRRLFVIARFDGEPIVWPKPTHGKGRLPYVPVSTCIDFSAPACSIFASRSEAKAWGKANGRGAPVRPLAANTLRRVAHGVQRYVLEAAEPFLVNLTHGGRVEAVSEPIKTITGAHRGEKALVAPTLVQLYGKSEAAPADLPLATITGKPKAALAQTSMVYLAKHYGGPNGEQAVGQPVTEPCATITASGQLGPVAAVVERVTAPGLVAYYGSERDGQSVCDPMRTVTVKDRLGLFGAELAQCLTPEQHAGAERVAAFLRAHGVPLPDGLAVVRHGGEVYVVVDITLRMLDPRELLKAQGFPADHKLRGTRAQQIGGIGNSVSPVMARALVAALALGRRPARRRVRRAVMAAK